MKCFNCGKIIEENILTCPYCKKEQGISRELFESAKEGNQQAYAQIYNCCYGNVYYTVKSMIRDEDTIQDIVQDTFIQAFRSLDTMVYSEGKFQAWMRRIAHNATVDYVRKKKPVLFSEMETDDEATGIDFKDEREDHMPESVIDKNETTRLIQEILNTLSDEQRLAVGMYYYEQYSIKEIAETISVSEGTVKSRLNYARRKIEEKVRQLEKKGTKLYGLSPVPFLLFLFRNQGVQTTETPNVHTLHLVQQALSAAKKSGAAAGKIGGAAVEKTTVVATEKTAEVVGAAAGKGWGMKLTVGVLTLAFAGGGIVYAISSQSPQAVAMQPETESTLPTESEMETVVIESAEPHAMIADVPDWEEEEPNVLGNTNLLRSEVTSITFLTNADDLTGYAENMVWDVSEEGDGSVMAYAVENAEAAYALYIVSDCGVYANADSSYMFAYYSSVVTISFNGLFHTDYVTDMSGLFSDDNELVEVDLTGFITSNVTDMNSMFSGCYELQIIDVSLWNTVAVTDMSYMFQQCTKLAGLDLSGFDTSNVEYMNDMFEDCHALGTLDISSFDTSNVTDMSYMFKGCQALTSLDVSSFDTANVTDMSYMFEACKMLESLELSSFDTSQVTSMSAMFEDCAALTSLDISSFDTANVNYMDNMFSGCTSLTTLDVSSFRTGNVGNMNGMFRGCESLLTLNVSNFDTSAVGDMSEMFYNCTSLSVDLSSFDLSNVSNTENMTEGCRSITGLED